MKYNIAIIGGGAAGYFAAINAAKNYPNKRIILLEKHSKILQKVKVSGGGRCNVTNACFDNKLLAQNYPRGHKELPTAFSIFSVQDTINWFEKHNVKLHTEWDNRMFPETNNSQTIIDCLTSNFNNLGCELKLNAEVISVEKKENGFMLFLKENDTVFTDKLIVTTGGFNQLKGYDWLKNIGHKIVAPVPSLFTFNLADKEITKLMGVSVPHAKVKIKGINYSNEGALLITHWGLSGPVILKLSSFAAADLHKLNYEFEIQINWLPTENEERIRTQLLQLKQQNNRTYSSLYKAILLPKRLLEFMLIQAEINIENKIAETPNKNINRLVQTITAATYSVKGKTTFKEEFVTCGGINLKEINFKTMESTVIKGLYFAGEVLNIDGITGGFNFQAAWTTAYIAAKLGS